MKNIIKGLVSILAIAVVGIGLASCGGGGGYNAPPSGGGGGHSH